MKALIPALWAFLIALACASALIIAAGGAPLEVYRLLAAGTWGHPYGIGQALFKTTPLIFTGLAVSLALRAGLFNIGAEGQLTIGAFLTALVGMHAASLPAALAVPLALLAGAAGGAAVAAIAGALKAWRGAHEVINTIMLNFIVRAAMVGVGTRLFEREQIHTAPIADSARLPRLGQWLPALHGSAANASLLVALAAAIAVAVLLQRTRFGFALRAVGAAPDVLGYKHYYEDGFSGGVGYMGIAVAVLGGARPLGVVIAALVFGTLSQGALAVNALVPKELVDVLVAVIIFVVAAALPSLRAWIAGAGARS